MRSSASWRSAKPSPVEVDFEAAVKKVKELQAAPKARKNPGKSGD